MTEGGGGFTIAGRLLAAARAAPAAARVGGPAGIRLGRCRLRLSESICPPGHDA